MALPRLWQGGAAIDDLGANTSTSLGTSVVTGAANTKGSWTQLIASTTQQYAGLLVTIRSSNSGKATVDLGIGAAMSEVLVIPDLACENREIVMPYWLPLAIPVGQRIAARAQDGGAGGTVTVEVHGITGCATIPEGFQRATCYGFTAASTTGTVIDAGAVANTKGAYAQIVASTANPIKQLFLEVGSPATLGAATVQFLFDLAVGAGGSEVTIVQNLHLRAVAGGFFGAIYGPFPVDIPAGTRLSARCQADVVTDANARTFQLLLYGLD